MKAVVAAFNQEKALVGAFSVITNLRMELFEALASGANCALSHLNIFCCREKLLAGEQVDVVLTSKVEDEFFTHSNKSTRNGIKNVIHIYLTGI